jgi:T5SS/PEP-CTERM-associated repeat protein
MTKLLPADRKSGIRQGLLALLAVFAGSCCNFVFVRTAIASVTAAGNVTPSPPAAGGSVAGPFLVGDTGTGTLAISAGTALTVTGNSTTVGDDATALGIVSLSGLGSDLTTANDLVIGNNGAGTVAASNLSKISIADDLILGINTSASGELDVNNFGAVVDVFDTVTAGNSGTAIIRVSGGGRLFADDSVIGAAALGNGRITVTGANSLWQQANSITVGEAGHGEFNLLDQAHMQTTNAVIGNAATGVGVVNLSDAGSVWDITGFLNVGIIGRGVVNILQGGRVATTSNVRIATIAAGEGHIEVSGANSALNIATTLTIGEFGFGTLSVLNGGRVTSTTAALGDDSGSRGEAIVDGNGSTWEITGTLDVSDPGQAMLTISNGGLVKSTSTAIVRAAGQLVLNGGRLEAGGISGLQDQGLIRGGGDVVGAATNTATGKIEIGTGNTLVFNNNLSSSGLVSLRDGELKVLGTTTNTGDIDIRNGTARFQSGLSNLSGSQLAILGGEVDVFGAVTNAVGAQMVVGGEAHAALHDAFTNNGSLLILPGAELVTLENLSFGAASALNLELSSDDATNGYGRADAGGTATLAGALNVALVDGFVPESGDTFTVLTALAGRSGTFATEMLPALGGGIDFSVTYTANSVVISVTGVEGDYNHDGVVDAADYIIFRKTLGQNGADLPADGNHNHQIDVGDYDVWRANFGNSASGSALDASASVPEPANLLVILVGMSTLLYRPRSVPLLVASNSPSGRAATPSPTGRGFSDLPIPSPLRGGLGRGLNTYHRSPSAMR